MKNEKELDWSNLEESKCPRCGEKLELMDGVFECSSFDCIFSIRESRALEILEDMENRNEYDGYNFFDL